MTLTRTQTTALRLPRTTARGGVLTESDGTGRPGPKPLEACQSRLASNTGSPPGYWSHSHCVAQTPESLRVDPRSGRDSDSESESESLVR